MGEILRKAVEKNWAFWICLIVSILLILGGAFTPPPFVIDSSIFIATGEMFAFASLWAFYKAIDKGVDTRIRKGDTEINIDNPDNKDKNRIYNGNQRERNQMD